MRIAVIGLGSMGKRRIRLIREMYKDYQIVGVDGRLDRREEVQGVYGISCYEKLNHIDLELDCIFVCTSPLSHSSIIREALERGCHVFTELNLVTDGYDENTLLAKQKRKVLFLSSTFLYREETIYLHNQITDGRNWNYIYHTGQYLPDWHPWESYKDFFLGDKRTNGCREIMAIELPWLVGAFGDIEDFSVLSDRQTKLNIDYNDNYMIQLKHKNGNKGSLIVDVVSPHAVRNLEVYTENRYYSWSGTPESLMKFNPKTKTLERVELTEKTEHMEGYCASVVENAYTNEIRAFFHVVKNGKRPIYGFDEDKKILKLIDSIGA